MQRIDTSPTQCGNCEERWWRSCNILQRRHSSSTPTVHTVHNVTDLEFVLIKIDTPTNATIATVYRQPHYSLDKFLPNLRSLLDYLDMMRKNPVIICGDFNEDPLSPGRKAILELFQSKEYTQLITSATTDKHMLLDHIYISHPDVCLQSGVLQAYHSYHNPVYCFLQK